VAERRRERDERKQELEDSLREAEVRTREAQDALEELRDILAATLRVDDRIDWDKLKQHQPFSQPQPQERPYLPIPQEPQPDESRYRPQLGLIDKFLRSSAEKKKQAAQAFFQADHVKWQERVASIQATNQRIYEANARELEDWQRRAAAYEEARGKHNAAIEHRRADYQALNPEAILDYCDLVLSESKYPEGCPQNFELDYRQATKTLIVEYQLPAPTELPRLEEVKFVRSKSTFVEAELTKRQSEQLYEAVVCQTAIRTLHELFEADVVRAVDFVVFNGMVRAVNPGTGNVETRCVMSVRAGRAAFSEINLRQVEARACFDLLGGVAGAKLADLRGVTPLSALNREEDRFSHAEDIGGKGGTELDEWQELVKDISEPTDAHFLKLGSVAALIGFPSQKKYSVSLSRELAQAVRSRSLAIEPDAGFGGPSYRADDEVVLFRPLSDGVTAAYVGASALLHFCVMIAAADEHPTEAELEVARNFINKNSTLTPHERQRLQFLEQLLCRNPHLAKRPLTRLAKRLPVEQRQMVGEVLVCVAGADGIISSSEWAALDRACKTLELAPSALEDILHRLGATFEEPTVQEAAPGQPGEPLPARTTAPSAPIAPAFKLDMARVAAISNETAQVIGLLSAVMREEDAKPASRPAPAIAPATTIQPQHAPPTQTPAWLATLHTKYQPIAARIVAKPTWTRTEFQQLAAEFKLMPLGVSDALNEWADEHLGDFLLEGEDPITVNTSIITK
jgi:tellurite resistance protein